MLELILAAMLAGSEPATVLTDIPEKDPFHVVVVKALAAAGTREAVRFERPGDVVGALKKIRPRHVIVVVRPETLDVNLAYDLLDAFSRVDDDPFVDLGYGVITGRTPEAALAFLEETQAVRRKPGLTPRSVMDNLGPNMVDNDRLILWGRANCLPPLKGGFKLDSMNHGRRGYPDDRLDALEGWGFIHLGGHGVPDRIEQGLTAGQIAKVTLRHAVIFNGACWTGVTRRSFDWRTGRIRAVETEDSFCLNALERGAAAYLAALHPDHGIPVYQEMERMFWTGESLGEVMKHTYDQVVVASGGKRPALPRWRDGERPPVLGRGKVELYGTAARVLFGDPRLRPTRSVVKPPYGIKVKPVQGGFRIAARMRNADLRFTHMDTFAGDLAANPMQFNDRFYLQAPVPAEFPAGTRIESVEVVSAKAKRKDVKHRLVGFALEEWDGRRILHVQVDFPTRGYQVSDIRNPSAHLELLVRCRPSDD